MNASFDSILLLSGGMDSNVVLAMLVARGRRPLCLTFSYGQTLTKEIVIASENAERAGCPAHVVELDMTWMAPNCVLLGDGHQIPQGRSREVIAAAGTPSTYVPFRNGIMLSIAAAAAEGHGVTELFMGANGLDSGNYWDDTMSFASAMERAIDEGTDPKWRPAVRFPLAEMSKAEAASIGRGLGVEFHRTWSCYHNGKKHCGACDSCVQRAAALGSIGLDIEGGNL